MTIPATRMRRVMGQFVTGVSVVTTEADGVPHGMTANSLTSVSLEPPMLLVCLGSGARTTEALTQSGRFVVNILSLRQEWVASRFARPGIDHFDGLSLVRRDKDEPPIVPDALVHAHCRVESVIEAGDHQIVLGLVEHVSDREGEPLGFHRGRFCQVVDHGNAGTYWF